jgi:hypothetical protein
MGKYLLFGALTDFWFSCFASWEQWILRVIVNNTPKPISNDTAAVMERQRIQVTLITPTDLGFNCIEH